MNKQPIGVCECCGFEIFEGEEHAIIDGNFYCDYCGGKDGLSISELREKEEQEKKKTVVYLTYWTPTRLCKRKKCDSVEQAREIGRRLKKKKGYLVYEDTCIVEYETVGEKSVGKIHDLYEED